MKNENLPFVCKTKPYPYQLTAYENAHKVLCEQGFFNLFMEMGMGKSKVAIDLARNMYEQGLIDAVFLIAPNGIHEQWFTEQLPIHTDMDEVSPFLWENRDTNWFWGTLDNFIEPGTDTKYTNPPSGRLKWLFVNVERFSTNNPMVFNRFKKYLETHKVLMIVDEATRIKNPSANRSKAINSFGKLASYRLPLTGTPVTNSPFDVFNILDFCKPGFWGCNYFMFKNRYGIFIRDSNKATGKKFSRELMPHEFEMVRSNAKKGFSTEDISAIMGISESSVQYIIENPSVIRPYKKLSQIKEKLLPVSYTVKKVDHIKDLPEKIYTKVVVNMSKDQERIYKDLKKKLVAEYQGMELTVTQKMTLYLRFQQISGGFFPYQTDDGFGATAIGKKNPKLDRLTELTEETGEAQIIVWSRFVPEIKLIQEGLQKSFPFKIVRSYYGDISKRDREDTIDGFKTKEVDILVMNPQTGAMGLNLQNAFWSFFFSNDPSLEKRLQAEDRTHRIGQKMNCQYIDLVCKGTVDEKIMEALRAKKDISDYFKGKKLGELI